MRRLHEAFKDSYEGNGYFSVHYFVVLCLVGAGFFGGLCLKSWPRTRVVTRTHTITRQVRVPVLPNGTIGRFDPPDVASRYVRPPQPATVSIAGRGYTLATGDRFATLHLVGTDTGTSITDMYINRIADVAGHPAWAKMVGSVLIRVSYQVTFATYTIEYIDIGNDLYWKLSQTSTDPLGAYDSAYGIETGSWNISGGAVLPAAPRRK